MSDPEREVEMELEGDSNEVSGSPTTRSPSQFMDYEMGMMFSSLSPLDSSFDYSVSLWNSPSPGRRPQSPEFEISLWNFPSPSRCPSPEPGFSLLISSHGNASSSTQPPVCSPSPPFREQAMASSLQQKCQVFISVSGGDTRCTFTSHLCEALKRKGMDYFRDDKLLRGAEISPSLLTTIEESTIFIIIFSVNYASSSLCLQELSKILECRKTKGQIVVPIFYHVEPSYVRYQMGSFEIAFAKHQIRFKDRTGKVERWKAALEEVSNLAGIHIHRQSLYSEHIHEICECIVSKSTRSPPGPNGLPDGEEMLHQDSLEHQLVEETHAMNDGENVLSEGGIPNAVSYPENEENEGKLEENVLGEGGIHSAVSCPENEGKLEELECHAMNDGENVLSDGGIHSAVSYPENEGTRKTLKRKHGKNKIQIPPEDLLTFSGTLMDAVKHFKVSESTIKRRCREHGITNWQYRTIDNNSQSLSKPKDIIESTQGEGAETGNQMASGSESRERELNHEPFGFPPESEESLDMSQCIQAAGELLKDHNISAIVAYNTEQVPESSRTNLSCSIPVPKLPEATAAHMIPLVTETQDTRTVTIKATYEEDMIRFQLSLTSGITELRREVAERLKLEVDSFSIKYLDDDDDSILMTGDKDLHECFKISVSLGRKFIKLSIHKR